MSSDVRHVVVYGPDAVDPPTVNMLTQLYEMKVACNATGMPFDELAIAARNFRTPTLFHTADDLSQIASCDRLDVVPFSEAVEESFRMFLCAGDEPPNMSSEERVIYYGIKTLCSYAHRRAEKWYQDPETGEPIERNFGEVIALMHSELSEALEHDRKGTPDDKLPDRPGPEVEFGDLFIRGADTSEHRGYDLAGAIIAKMRFNLIRPDHKPENRAAASGKKY